MIGYAMMILPPMWLTAATSTVTAWGGSCQTVNNELGREVAIEG